MSNEPAFAPASESKLETLPPFRHGVRRRWLAFAENRVALLPLPAMAKLSYLPDLRFGLGNDERGPQSGKCSQNSNREDAQEHDETGDRGDREGFPG
jgi:hypothetical protein